MKEPKPEVVPLVEESTSNIKNGKLVFNAEPKNSQITKVIKKSYKKRVKKDSLLSAIAEEMKKDLDEKFQNGWVVFVGKHMVGACTYVEGTLASFEVDGVAFVIFQTYCPNN